MIKHIYPTFPKIIFYALFTMVTPALFSVCNEAGCSYKMKFFPAFVLLRTGVEGYLSVSAIVLWLAMSYLLACILEYGIKKFSERRKRF